MEYLDSVRQACWQALNNEGTPVTVTGTMVSVTAYPANWVVADAVETVVLSEWYQAVKFGTDAACRPVNHVTD